ncbi:hypothetical protein MTYM_02023 [Methylococcales bacterium]|nr:hypothetical protein MTYM_02023 [Methylococcales bacterium]
MIFFDAAPLSVSNNGSPWRVIGKKLLPSAAIIRYFWSIRISTTRIFEAGHASAVRLPPEFGFQPGDEVEIVERGGEWIIRQLT